MSSNKSKTISARTSAYQFEVLVSYMEEHGDLSRPPPAPTDDLKPKISYLHKWEELTAMLNSDVSGEAKNSARWKKVWGDFKNNTKKKLRAIQKAAAHGQECSRKLSEIEVRALNVIGIPVVVSDEIETLDDNAWSLHDEETTESKPKRRRNSTVYRIESLDDDLDDEKSEVMLKQYTREPTIYEVPSADHNYHEDPLNSPKLTGDPPKSPIPITSDEYWKRFRVQQHQDNLSLRREENKIRKLEIRAQMRWQELGNRAMDLLDKVVNKYCNNNKE